MCFIAAPMDTSAMINSAPGGIRVLAAGNVLGGASRIPGVERTRTDGEGRQPAYSVERRTGKADLLYYTERAAQVQLYAMWTGQELLPMTDDVLHKTMNLGAGQPFKLGKGYDYHFAALKRILDRKEPDYNL